MSWVDGQKEEEKRDAEYLIWIRSLKVGDRVSHEGRGWSRGVRIYEISRVTPAQLIAEIGGAVPIRFNRKNGRLIGGDSWSAIGPITQEIMDRVERSELVAWFGRLNPGGLSLEKLRAMKAVCKN